MSAYQFVCWLMPSKFLNFLHLNFNFFVRCLPVSRQQNRLHHGCVNLFRVGEETSYWQISGSCIQPPHYLHSSKNVAWKTKVDWKLYPHFVNPYSLFLVFRHHKYHAHYWKHKALCYTNVLAYISNLLSVCFHCKLCIYTDQAIEAIHVSGAY